MLTVGNTPTATSLQNKSTPLLPKTKTVPDHYHNDTPLDNNHNDSNAALNTKYIMRATTATARLTCASSTHTLQKLQRR